MYKSVLAILGFLACTEAAKIAKLIKDEPVVYCGVTDLIACAGEIETAWDKCSSAGSVDDVLECIQDILGASDCIDCVCEITGLCKKEKDEPVTYCGVTDLIACAGEIETAWDKCSSAGSVDDVLQCIQDILGASDCIDCVCDITGLCKKEKDEPVVYCGVTDLIACAGEIETAWDKCSSAGSVDDVLECIQDILGASDCIDCVCEITGLCKKEKDEPVVYCGVTDLIACAGEIETAWDKCSAAGSVDDVLECIQDILGASDCIDCVCEITGLCKKEK